MTAETLSAAADVHQPGRCAEHPGQELISHKSAQVGHHWWGDDDKPTVCPELTHRTRVPQDYERCRWCGGPLYTLDELARPWRTSRRRAFCTSNHRLQAHRARTRADPRRIVAQVLPPK